MASFSEHLKDAPAPLSDAAPNLRKLIIGGTGFLAVCSAVGVALSPYLLVEFPLMLVGLAPDNRHILLAAAQADPWALIAVGTVRRQVSLLSTYGLSGLYGPAALRWSEQRFPRFAAVARWLERFSERGGAPLLVISPGYTFVTFAGVRGMPFKPFLIAITIGNLIFMILAVYFGDAVSAWSQLLIEWLKQHLVGSTLVCILLVAIQQLISRRRGGGLPKMPADSIQGPTDV